MEYSFHCCHHYHHDSNHHHHHPIRPKQLTSCHYTASNPLVPVFPLIERTNLPKITETQPNHGKTRVARLSMFPLFVLSTCRLSSIRFLGYWCRSSVTVDAVKSKIYHSSSVPYLSSLYLLHAIPASCRPCPTMQPQWLTLEIGHHIVCMLDRHYMGPLEPT